jgi:adenosylmethionine-8-amino-7-oxononanoate aminotransferase
MDPELARRYPFISRGRRPAFAIERTEGVYLITPDGQRILDAAGGAIVSNIGHGRKEVAEAGAQVLSEVTYVVPTFATESRVRLVERLQDHWLPGGLRRVLLTSGGSESVDTALRLARQHHVSAGRPERWKVIGRQLSYHGTTLATLAVGGHTKRRRGFDPMLVDYPKVATCYPLRCELCQGEEGCSLACADQLEEVIEREGPESVAAFIAEPVGGSTVGGITPPDGYWQRIAEICRAHGVLIIADEVMTGFGRTGRRFAIEHWEVPADILVSGKGLGGGYTPIGAVFAKEEVVAPIAERRDEVMFYTFGAHPASCAIADKVLEIMQRESLVERAAEMGALLRERLEQLAGHPHVAEIRGLGLLQAIELVKDRETLEPFPAEARFTARVVSNGLGNGVFFYPGGAGPARDVICLGPPFVITPEEIELVVSVLEQSIDETVARVEG